KKHFLSKVLWDPNPFFQERVWWGVGRSPVSDYAWRGNFFEKKFSPAPLSKNFIKKKTFPF
ncbi:MAG: hypothetical protein IJW97_02335, partial [Clostridia bacterium]|nr:hypothetical protein [Clostridia bacterium]